MARFTVADLNGLAELAAAMMSAEQMDAFARTAGALGDRYSLRNRFLMWVQDPNVSNVAGFVAWKEHGRAVRKGGKGIAILAPLSSRKKAEGEKAEGEKPAAETEGGKAEKRRVYGVKITYVFDVSQTEPAEGSEDKPVTPTPGIAPSADEVAALVASLISDDEQQDVA